MVSKLSTKAVVLFFSLGMFDHALAKETLWLSDIRTGDCVADRIQARKTSFNLAADKQYCIKGNAGDAEKIKICQKNSAFTEQVVFFTDRCSDEYYLGLNGTEYTLKRRESGTKYYTPLIGNFYAKGLKVEVKSLRLIDVEYEEGTKHVQSGTYKVLITIQKDKVVKKFNGDLSFGP